LNKGSVNIFSNGLVEIRVHRTRVAFRAGGKHNFVCDDLPSLSCHRIRNRVGFGFISVGSHLAGESDDSLVTVLSN